MANNYTSYKDSYLNASIFNDSFADITSISSPHKPYYVFLGNDIPYLNSDTLIPAVTDSTATEKSIWRTMFSGKKVTSRDVQFVVPRLNWTTNRIYKIYDDTSSIKDLITQTGNNYPYYVITDDLNVYVCINNNLSANSTVKPTGNHLSSNGYYTTGDGYVWKYLYNIKPSNKFIDSFWIPVPSNINELDYATGSTNLSDGAISKILLTDGGSGYFDSPITVSTAFSSGCSILQLASTTNVASKMFIVGANIATDTYITSVDTVYNRITLSFPTIGSGSVGYGANISTRTVVTGDGNNDIKTNTQLHANGKIKDIVVTTRGTGYSFANVAIYGTGTNASARAILPPKFGHGFNPARELAANSVMISTIIGSIDSSEGGSISTNTSFRQYGLLYAPNKYNETESVDLANANNVISQTMDLTVISGSAYTKTELVYQGPSLEASTFRGTVHDQTSNVIRLVNVYGTPTIGSLLYGNTSVVTRAVQSYKNPDLEPETGDILYVQNDYAVNRTNGQAENIKFVIKF